MASVSVVLGMPGTAGLAENHETQAQAHRADVRLAEGEPQSRYSLRQTGKKFCRHGHIGQYAAMPTSVLFVQNLG